MMSQRFNLFYAGFTVSLPAIYFNKLKLKEALSTSNTEALDPELSLYMSSFDLDRSECESHLVSTSELAKHFEIEAGQKPESALDFFKWQNDLIAEFESKFPMGRIEHYYFLYARRLGELIHNMLLIKTCVDIQLKTDHKVSMLNYYEKYLKDSEYIVFKLMAPAALLSSEPRQSCFNNLFKQMNEEIKSFKNLNLEANTEEELMKLKALADNFHVLLVNGFKTCIALLKEQ